VLSDYVLASATLDIVSCGQTTFSSFGLAAQD